MSEASPSTKRQRKERPSECSQTRAHSLILSQEFWMESRPHQDIGVEECVHVYPDMVFTTENKDWRVAVECKEEAGMQALTQALGQAVLYKQFCEYAVICFPDSHTEGFPPTWVDAVINAGILLTDRSGLADLVRLFAPECERPVGRRRFMEPRWARWYSERLNLYSDAPEFVPLPKRWQP